MINGAFALAFLSGVVATVNPCGFAMLPAYLSYFLGIESHAAVDEPAQASLRRALLVSASVSAGFLAVFTVLGFVIRAGGDGVADVIRYLSIVIGFLLIGLGIAFLLGRTLTFATPKLDRGGRTRTAWSMFVFGISYAVASFGCTIGPFVLTVLGSFTRDGTLSGVLMIVAYGLGMGLLLTTLTVTLALARGGLLRGLRSAMRWIDSVAGVLLILAGLYLVYYWWYDLVSDTGAKQVAGGGLSAWFQSQADRVAGWLNDRGAGPLALVLGIVTVAAIAMVLAPADQGARDRRVAPPDDGTRWRPPTPRHPMFAELLAHPGVEEVVELRGSFGFMAYHGGSLEEATDVIAQAAAEQAGASYYGVHQPADLQWHIPSTQIDPAESSAPRRLPRPRRRGDHRPRLRPGGLVGAAPGRWHQPPAGRAPRRPPAPAAARVRGRHRPRGHPTRAPRPPPPQPRQPGPPGRRAAGAAAAGAGHQPALLGLGGPGPQPPHAGRGRRPRRHRGSAAGLSRAAQGARRSMIQGPSTVSRR